MKFEAEIVAKELLPAIRSILASDMSREYGMTQEEIASRLELTQPAVSQYINQERADQEVVEEIRSDPQVSILLDDAASNAAQGKEFLSDVRQAVKTVKDKGLFREKFQDTEKL